MLWLIPALAAAALLSWLLVDLTRRTALRWNLVDVPNERSSHLQPIPLCGGLPLVAINVAAWLVLSLVHPLMPERSALAFIAGAALISGISLLDDLDHVPAPLRLAVHTVAAVAVMVGCGYWRTVTVPLFGAVALPALGALLTLVWIVGLTNAFNFMDGIDGMAGGQAMAAGAGWLALGFLTHRPFLIALGGLLGATSLGFLIHNWHPATIFMGDVGSTFLGYSFAVLPLTAVRADSKLALVGVLLVWPAVFDTGITLLRRLRHGQSIFIGHRTFLFHRLVDSGWSHASAALLYLPLPILGAILACTWDTG